ncbi:MAG: Amuc_1100 family pilus-like protein [Kiritimatiellae bacterium]|nr:Amuc_1100 family pilus-like protein [Kiritimatiellia bacterium]
MNRNQTILAAAGGVSGVVLLGIGWLTFSSWQSAAEAESKMKRSKSALSRIYQESVTPSEENVSIVEANRDRARDWVGSLSRGIFRDGLALDDTVTRGDFQRVCRETVQALVADAPLNAAEDPVTDADAGFGFDYYLGGNLPQRDEYVPRLLRQLRLADKIVRLLYEAGIQHLDGVARETFDLGGAAASADSGSSGGGGGRPRGRARGRGAATAGSGPAKLATSIAVPAPKFRPDDSVPMTCERLGFLFTTRQEGLIAAVNAIDAMRPFAVVSGLSFAKTGEDVLVPAAPDPVAEAAAAEARAASGIMEKPAPRTARLVSGPLFESPVQVTLYVDVFSPVAPAGGAPAADGAEDGAEEE